MLGIRRGRDDGIPKLGILNTFAPEQGGMHRLRGTLKCTGEMVCKHVIMWRTYSTMTLTVKQLSEVSSSKLSSTSAAIPRQSSWLTHPPPIRVNNSRMKVCYTQINGQITGRGVVLKMLCTYAPSIPHLSAWVLILEPALDLRTGSEQRKVAVLGFKV